MNPSQSADFVDHSHVTSGTEKSDATKILTYTAILVILWAASVATFGVVGLYLPAVALVPVIYAVLIMITWDNET